MPGCPAVYAGAENRVGWCLKAATITQIRTLAATVRLGARHESRVSGQGKWRTNPGKLDRAPVWCIGGVLRPVLQGNYHDRRHHAPNARSRRTFRPPDPLLEPQDGARLFSAPAGKIHIINLEKTLPLMVDALNSPAVWLPGAATSFLSAPSAPPALQSVKKPPVATCRSCRTAGWAAC